MSEPKKIPFNLPFLAGHELLYIAQAADPALGCTSGDGHFTRKCNELLEQALGAGRVLLTTSCTHALEIAALLLDLEPGDEVLVPAFTFVTTASAFALHGARPVFADVRPDTLNLDEERLAEKMGPRTRAVVPVHYGGVACAMEAIVATARARGARVVEDAAHGIFTPYRGRMLGTLGALGALSFHETKNFSCGEGGALVVNDETLVERAEILREKGTDRARFFRGEVDKYTWVDLGSSYLPSDILAAFLYAQLEARDRIQDIRRRIWHTYNDGLAPWASSAGVQLPVVPEGCEPGYHLFHLLLPTPEARAGLIRHLAEENIQAIFHYAPLNASRMGKAFGAKPGDCPVAEDVSERLLRLPFYNDLSPEQQDRILNRIRTFQP